MSAQAVGTKAFCTCSVAARGADKQVAEKNGRFCGLRTAATDSAGRQRSHRRRFRFPSLPRSRGFRPPPDNLCTAGRGSRPRDARGRRQQARSAASAPLPRVQDSLINRQPGSPLSSTANQEGSLVSCRWLLASVADGDTQPTAHGRGSIHARTQQRQHEGARQHAGCSGARCARCRAPGRTGAASHVKDVHTS